MIAMHESKTTTTWRVDETDFYVVALLDVLGQSQKLASLDYLPTTADEQDRFDQEIQGVFRPVLTLRESFATHASETATNVVSFLSQRRHRQVSVAPGVVPNPLVRFMQVADAVIAFAPALDESNHLNVGIIFSFLCACAVSVVSSLEDGVPIRGAIEIGMGALLPERDLYGPAISNVHSMESKQACYPRVLIGPKLKANLEALRERDTATPEHEDYSELAKECLEMMFVDDDNRVTLDYLGQAFLDALQERPQWSSARRKASAFVRTERARFERDGPAKLQRRYDRLFRYFESRGLFRPVKET